MKQHTSGVLHLWGQLCHVLDKLLNPAVKFTGGKHPSEQVPVKCFLSCQLPVQEEELIRLQRGWRGVSVLCEGEE